MEDLRKKRFFYLLIVAGALAIYFFLFLAGKEHFDKEKKKIFDFQQETLQQIIIEKDKTRIILQKTPQDWIIKEPSFFLADKLAVDKIISALEKTRIMEIVEKNPPDISQFGLVPSLGAIKVEVETDKKRKTLIVGNNIPLNKLYVYAKLEGEKEIFTTYADIKEAVNVSLFDLRDKRILSIDDEKIQKIEFLKNSVRIVVEKKQNGWQITHPLTALANIEKIQSILQNLKDLRAKKFIPKDASTLNLCGLATPLGKISIWEEDKKTPLLFFLGEKEGLFYVTTNFQNEIFLVEKKIVELFPEDIKALEENRILFFNPDKIKRIELSYPEYEIFLEKEKNKWKIVKPIFARADGDVVKILLWQIKNTEAEKFYPHRLTESPDLEKFLKIKLLEEENHLIEIFKKKKGGKEIFLGRSTLHFLPFELKREAVEKLIVNLMEIRDRYLLHFDPLAIWKIEIKYQKKEIVCEKKGTKWKITKPQNKLAENPKVWKIVFSLKDLEFEEILEEKMKNPEKYSLTNPYLEITLYDKKEKVGSIIFGKKLPGEKIAVTSTFVEGVYTIPFSFLENIPTEEREIEYIR